MKRSIIIVSLMTVLLCGLTVFAMGIEKKSVISRKGTIQTKLEKEITEGIKTKGIKTKEIKTKERNPKKASEKAMLQEKTETIPAVKQEEPLKIELDTVENNYFSDAVFIGDSRTEGFRLHSGLIDAGYLTAKGLNVKDVFDKPLIKENNVAKTIAQMLQEKTYQKYYIMLGANELGWVYTDIFTEKYGQIIDLIREVNPNATIYVQSILPVTNEKSQSDLVYNNANIVRFNELLKGLAKEKNVIYLSVNEAVQKEDGALQDEATTDGVHLNKEYCIKWLEYLKVHTDQNKLGEGKK